MAKGTRNAKLDEMMGLLKKTAEMDGKILHDLMERILTMDSKIEQLSNGKTNEKVEWKINPDQRRICRRHGSNHPNQNYAS